MEGQYVTVVGGGLAGLSAAHTVLEAGGRVLLLDKMAFLGGNSTKATSGINGALTKTQMKLGIPDSAEVFESDTMKSACGLNHSTAPSYTPPLAHVLTHDSGPAVDWLIERFGLDLSLVSQVPLPPFCTLTHLLPPNTHIVASFIILTYVYTCLLLAFYFCVRIA
jgi:succinate dehydrogenase/fumarate reductase flavoprotein subunit